MATAAERVFESRLEKPAPISARVALLHHQRSLLASGTSEHDGNGKDALVPNPSAGVPTAMIGLTLLGAGPAQACDEGATSRARPAQHR
jgi:hypothetical protein